METPRVVRHNHLLVNIKVLPKTRDKIIRECKEINGKRFNNSDEILLYLRECTDKYLATTSKQIGEVKKYTKRELFEKARDDYERSLDTQSLINYYIEEANRIKENYINITNGNT
jgi:hypothetical protein